MAGQAGPSFRPNEPVASSAEILLDVKLSAQQELHRNRLTVVRGDAPVNRVE
jgi:hypothetical protein